MGAPGQFINSPTGCFLQFLFLFLVLNKTNGFSAASETCLATERKALLAFKQHLVDPSGRLSSWYGYRCCEWVGVGCDAHTGHVIRLDLRNPDASARKRTCLRGKLSSSLLDLKFLSYLDLSLNDFDGAEIPEFLGGFVSLKYLNLSYSSFTGAVPYHLGNLSKLESLDIYGDSFSNPRHLKLHADSLHWITGLSSLKFLNLGYVNLSAVGDSWLQAISKHAQLVELHMYRSELHGFPSSLQDIQLTSLSVLDLSQNTFNSPLPDWLFNLIGLRKLYLRWDFLHGLLPNDFRNLRHLQVLDLSNNLGLEGRIPPAFGYLSELTLLDLSANNFRGSIHGFFDSFAHSKANNSLVFLDLSSNSLEGTLPESLGLLKKLQILDLSSNLLSGSIPSSIRNLMSLRKIDLSYNQMNGTIPESFGQLVELVDVNLMANSWQGTLTQAHFAKLMKLVSFRITIEAGHLVIDPPSKWVPPFRLKLIQLENCQVGPRFPVWLQSQTELDFVVLRKVGISDKIPKQWLLKISSQVSYLILSNNELKGELPRELKSPNLRALDLSSNRIEGTLPVWSTNATEVFLHDNLFRGSLPPIIDKLVPKLQKLYLAGNNLSGVIPSSFCEIKGLQVLSLRDNHFVGEIPNCWHRSLMLWGIDMANNDLSGRIPSSLGQLPSLSVLLLGDNNLKGLIPPLMNCTGLTSIDFRGNKIVGTLPEWVDSFTSLFMLSLGSNSMSGEIPKTLCSLQNLDILDLSGNRFSGPIPWCFGNLTTLSRGTSIAVFENLLNVVTRRRRPAFSNIIAGLNSIDLSRNNITAEIPDEILGLHSIRILNLSTNLITGKISAKFGELHSLESLDLSWNKLSGRIPQTLSSLDSLTRLNLSYNALSGQIPSLPKFNDPSIFLGNPLLCGNPLPRKC